MSTAERNERSSPTVSIIMPVRNAAAYIGDAIDGVLGQTFADFELLVVGDGADHHSHRVKVPSECFTSTYSGKD